MRRTALRLMARAGAAILLGVAALSFTTPAFAWQVTYPTGQERCIVTRSAEDTQDVEIWRSETPPDTSESWTPYYTASAWSEYAKVADVPSSTISFPLQPWETQNNNPSAYKLIQDSREVLFLVLPRLSMSDNALPVNVVAWNSGITPLVNARIEAWYDWDGRLMFLPDTDGGIHEDAAPLPMNLSQITSVSVDGTLPVAVSQVGMLSSDDVTFSIYALLVTAALGTAYLLTQRWRKRHDGH